MDIIEMLEHLAEVEKRMDGMVTITFFTDGSGHIMVGEYGQDREIFQFDVIGELIDFITTEKEGNE